MEEDTIYQQMSIFDDVLTRYTIDKKVRLIEFFSGIGSQAKALEILGIPFEHYKTCEWAYNSYCAYNSIHLKDTTDYSKNLTKEQMLEKVKGTSTNYNEPLDDKALSKKSLEWVKNAYNNIIATHNLVNIMDVKGKNLEIVEKDKYCYVLTYSFPCQDLSLAGKRAGMSISQADGGTRSGLLWEVERILTELSRERESMPDILVMENVPEVCGSKNVRDFEKWQSKLNELGYTNYCEILNAKDYGIPQNRKRCFMVSILGNYNYTFPKKMPLKLRLKDLLEENVDEKYFLSQKMLDYCLTEKENFNRKNIFLRNLQNTEKGICGTLTTKEGSQATNPYICVKNNNSKGYEEAHEGDGIDISTRMESHRGTVQKDSCQTITTMGGNNVGVVVPLKSGYSCEIKEEKENTDKVDIIGNYSKSNYDQTSVIGKNGIAPTITENHGQVAAITMKQQLCNDLVKQGKVKEGDIVKHSFTSQIMQGKKKAVEKENEMITLTTRGDCFGVAQKQEEELRIRKLTPLECMKLMGFSKNDYLSMREIGLTDSAIYHCAGDSIVSTVLVAIFNNLIENNLNKHNIKITEYIERNLI